MKSNNLKSLLLFLAEAILIVGIGIWLWITDFHLAVNLIICLLLLIEILFVLKLLNDNIAPKSKSILIISIVLLLVLSMVMKITKDYVMIPNEFSTVYMLFMGFLSASACLNAIKLNELNSKTFKVIGAIVLSLSTIIGFLALFGIAK